MIIQELVITPDGQTLVDKEVPDNFFNEPISPPTPEETQNDIINMLVDYEYRLTLLEV